MCKLRHKVPNGQNLPHECPNFRNYLIYVILQAIEATFLQMLDLITKIVFFFSSNF